jgi:hypothetical protein
MTILLFVISYAIGAYIGELVHLKHNATDYERELLGFSEE